MKTSTKRTVSGVTSFAAVGAIVLGAFAFASVASEPEPAPSVAPLSVVDVEPEPFVAPISAEDEQIAADAVEAARIEAERLAAEKAAAEAAARAAAEAEAARIAAEQDAAQTDTGSGTAPAAPSSPARCGGGTVAIEVDGNGNDIGCMPPACFSLTLPDAQHPECVVTRP